MPGCLLVRHADAVTDEKVADDQRPLTALGMRQASSVGAAMNELGLTPELVLYSPKARTTQTAEQLVKALGGATRLEAEPQLTGDPFSIEKILAGREGICLVGHSPSLGAAIAEYIAGPGALVHISKGGLAAIEDGELYRLLAPVDLAAISGADLDTQ
jgi:phosphohistidine phosphatase